MREAQWLAACGMAMLVTALPCAAGCSFDTSYSSRSDGSGAGPDAAAGTDGEVQTNDMGLADSGPGTDAAGGTDSALGPDASAGTDAMMATDSGPPLGPFGPPTAIAALNTPNTEDDPSLTADMLEMFFCSNRPTGMGGGDIWVTTRTTIGAPWSAPANIGAVNTGSGETTPEISSDGLRLYLSSNRPGGMGNQDLYLSVRATRAGSWSAPMIVSELNSVDGDFTAVAADDQLSLIMASTRPGIGGFDLYESSRPMIGSLWAAPAMVTALDTANVETDPWVDPSRTVLYFSTDRTGGLGDWDIWMAWRPTTLDPWGGEVPVAELNSPALDSDVWLSPDMRTAYLSSNRNGDFDLFVFTR